MSTRTPRLRTLAGVSKRMAVTRLMSTPAKPIAPNKKGMANAIMGDSSVPNAPHNTMEAMNSARKERSIRSTSAWRDTM